MRGKERRKKGESLFLFCFCKGFHPPALKWTEKSKNKIKSAATKRKKERKKVYNLTLPPSALDRYINIILKTKKKKKKNSF
jgi:hypothetical protein